MVIHSLEFHSCCCNFVEFSNWIASARLLLYLHPCLFGSDVIFKEWMCFAYDSSSTTHGEAFSGHQRELITSSDKILFLKFIIRKKRGASERQKSFSLLQLELPSLLPCLPPRTERDPLKKKANYDSHWISITYTTSLTRILGIQKTGGYALRPPPSIRRHLSSRGAFYFQMSADRSGMDPHWAPLEF